MFDSRQLLKLDDAGGHGDSHILDWVKRHHYFGDKQAGLPFSFTREFRARTFSKLLSGVIELIEQFLLRQAGGGAGGGDYGLAFVTVHELGGFEQTIFFAGGDRIAFHFTHFTLLYFTLL